MYRKIFGLTLCFCLAAAGIAFSAHAAKRVLYIDSYHEGYEWSDGVTEGVRSVLDNAGVSLKVFRMDTKRHTDEGYKKNAALRAKEIIASYHPDVVIASDDNASKYLIMPYFKNASLPFVFCGVNYNADDYGFPL